MRHSQRWPRAGTWKRERERLAKAGGDDVKRGAGPAFQERQISCSRYEMSERLQSADAAVHPDLPDWQFAGTNRKSTRLNSSHVAISYAVFCLKKKKYNASIERLTGCNI